MKKKRFTALVLATALLFGGAIAVSASGFGSGVAVIASEAKIIKTGIVGQKIVFSDVDFKQGLGITDFDKIEITSIPLSTEGTLLLAGRRVNKGTVIKRKNIGALVFVPASKNVTECKFTFTTEDFADGNEIEFIIKFTEKVNYAPEVNEAVSKNVTTQREIPVHSRLSSTDKEGDVVEYIILSYPKSGTIELIDKTSGEYIYTPKNEFIGTDGFAYVARDEWGNFSKLSRVEIEVSERMSEVVYADMKKHPQYNAAVILTAMGITDGQIMGEENYFLPNASVSRVEFLSMAMKCAGIRVDTSIKSTYFDDNNAIPAPMIPYVSTAARLGIINGEFTNGKLLFRPNDGITKYEAGLIISKLINIGESAEIYNFTDSATVPVWARDEISALCKTGIFDYEDNMINGDAKLSRADTVDYLYKMLKYLEK